METAGGAQGKKQARSRNGRENLETRFIRWSKCLHRMEVTEIEPKEMVDRALHRVVSYEPADFAEDDGRIVMRVKRGFVWRDQVLRPEEVVAKRFRPDAADGERIFFRRASYLIGAEPNFPVHSGMETALTAGVALVPESECSLIPHHMSTRKAIGIDLGTTFSAVAHIDAYGKPQIIPNSESERITPSVILFEGGNADRRHAREKQLGRGAGADRRFREARNGQTEGPVSSRIRRQDLSPPKNCRRLS